MESVSVYRQHNASNSYLIQGKKNNVKIVVNPR